ncbi:MAG TPA: hypothetical protein VJY47_01335 [Candidatus Dojkabacteria bacterium]|nr:hypothetical protein [Candidatus Dojkabacteria bacterium]
MTKEEFRKIVDICSKQDEVKEAVKKNHDNNLWWPIEVDDYRKRLLIAGLSTRISYNMIDSYRKVINDLNSYSYEEITAMSKEKIINIIKSLGLSSARYKYLSSMIVFIEKYDNEIKTLSNDELIKLIADNVYGASYKVAQCCVLYLRGYYSGIMPVDSGMKDIQLPCLGFEQYKNASGHEILRKELEELVKDNNMEEIIKRNGYKELHIEDFNNATWFCHLVLIYYKRFFCNKHKPENCSFRDCVKLKYMCRRNSKR